MWLVIKLWSESGSKMTIMSLWVRVIVLNIISASLANLIDACLIM